METENSDDIWRAFRSVDTSDEQGSRKLGTFDLRKNYTRKSKEFINFEQYVKRTLHNKIQIFDREDYLQIKKPIIVFSNHFRVKCAYHTMWLDILCELTLKYGDQIKFLAADVVDIDVIYPRWNIFEFFCRPDSSQPDILAIDEKKRTYKFAEFSETIENLSELCDDLLSGSLFPSLPIPEQKETGLVKTCVHHNFEEMVSNSTKNIFLIICEQEFLKRGPNYEHIALAFQGKDYNLDFVYIDYARNYIPHKYIAKDCYPYLIFIPHEHKNKFIFYKGKRKDAVIIEFLDNILKHSELLQQIYDVQFEKNVKVPSDFQLDFEQLPEFFQRKFKNKFEVLKKSEVEYQKISTVIRKYFIIIFMDFPERKCLAHHVDWLNKIYPIASRDRGIQVKFFIADFENISIINSRWQPNDIKNSSQEKPKLFIIDHLQHTYEYGTFESSVDLAYFIEDLIADHIYYSELYPRKCLNTRVKIWTANYFNVFLKYCKKDVFITFYSSADEGAGQILSLLDEVADKVSDLNIEIAKFDVKLNYVDLEYASESYPVHYLISRYNKKRNLLFRDNDLCCDKIMTFIKINYKP